MDSILLGREEDVMAEQYRRMTEEMQRALFKKTVAFLYNLL
jgi:hypothetical protein